MKLNRVCTGVGVRSYSIIITVCDRTEHISCTSLLFNITGNITFSYRTKVSYICAYISGGIILEMKGRVKTLNEGKEIIFKVLNSGEALEKFRLMLISQGVTKENATTLCQGDMWSILPSVPPNHITIIKAYSSGMYARQNMVFPFNA